MIGKHGQAAFLAALVLGGQCPCFPDAIVVEARFQTRLAGFATDDLVVLVVDGAGRRRRLLLRVKHRVSLAESDREFGKALRAAWSDFHSPGNFDPDLDAIAVVTGPPANRAFGDGRVVLGWARCSSDSEEFEGKVEAAGFSSDGKRLPGRGAAPPRSG